MFVIIDVVIGWSCGCLCLCLRSLFSCFACSYEIQKLVMMEDAKCSGHVDARSRLLSQKMNNQALILTLPSDITIDILLSRLPIRAIIVCKNVCRSWRKLLSSSEFVKYHLSTSTGGLFIHLKPLDETRCRLVEFDSVLDLQHHDLHHKRCWNLT